MQPVRALKVIVFLILLSLYMFFSSVAFKALKADLDDCYYFCSTMDHPV